MHITYPLGVCPTCHRCPTCGHTHYPQPYTWPNTGGTGTGFTVPTTTSAPPLNQCDTQDSTACREWNVTTVRPPEEK